jgi:hypothetical protein
VIELNASQIRATGLNDEVSLCQMKPTTIDQSWMPNWYSNTKTNPEQDYVSDFEESITSDDDDDDDENHQLLNRVCKYTDEYFIILNPLFSFIL